ncbi:hypothetical protein BDV29DRAFT_171570 [Aspergillus leporis]|uniref:Uncharacterized protein n=1 Tax=Aspergillus leporis TaxID=41062 RepID=A0A5N5X832_9EURO|nr:hypothetical protein BDV29DRAFT_171570 [Aspergillus leporis]
MIPRCQTLKLKCKPASNRTKESSRQKPDQADVLSGLFSSTQQRPLSANIVDIHHQIFQDKFSKSGQQTSRAWLKTPDDSGGRPPVLDPKKADELLSKFRLRAAISLSS